MDGWKFSHSLHGMMYVGKKWEDGEFVVCCVGIAKYTYSCGYVVVEVFMFGCGVSGREYRWGSPRCLAG